MHIYVKFFFLALISNISIVISDEDEWWKYTTIYEVLISSFKDSDGDGVGDIKGLTTMLDHFVDLQIESVHISNVQKRPMDNFGYDVENFYGTDPLFGTMEDFEELIRKIKRRGLKLIMDVVLNHSSDKHPWFLKSVAKIEPYTDYYIWTDPNNYDDHGTPIPPNNWLSMEGNSAWKWNEERKQFYYHVFSEQQPDFNLRNPNLVEELKNMTKFWLDKGVSGICLETPGVYMEDSELRNEQIPVWIHNVSHLQLPDSYHEYTFNLNESYKFVHQLREFIDYHFDDTPKILISGERTSLKYTMKYYGTEDYKLVHYPINFVLASVTPFPNSRKLYNLIKNWLEKVPAGGIANWQAETHYDEKRIGSRLNAEYMDIMMILVMTLPGVASIYYGQEIGMMNTKLRPDQIRDKRWHDSGRSPMQWDDSMNAGFSSYAKTWLPMNSNYYQVNVATQKKQYYSRYKLCSVLSSYRRTDTFKYGDFQPFLISPWIFAFTRKRNGNSAPTY